MCNKQIVIRVVKEFAACINPQLLQSHFTDSICCDMELLTNYLR